jgi:4'-phosphopantetheinyl transferase EntD
VAQGIVGSISHDSRVAVAAVGTKRQVAALGIDIEPSEFLPPGLLEIVATPQERLILPVVGCSLPQKRPCIRRSTHSIRHFFPGAR